MLGTTRRIGAGAVALVVLGCSDAPTANSPGPRANRQVLPAPTQVSVVTRDVPLAEPESASQVIGVFGGQLTLPGAGLTVTIPAFAVLRPTLITVTAVAGRQVAYEFAPHGLEFVVPVSAVQRLDGTSAITNGLLPTTLYAGYFANVADLDQLNATATVSELLSTSIVDWNRTVSFAIQHFSGYLIAAGESAPGEGSQ